MHYILIFWLAGGTPASVTFGSVDACINARSLFMYREGPGDRGAFCVPDSGSGPAFKRAAGAANAEGM